MARTGGRRRQGNNGERGRGVDAAGEPAYDPTENVFALVETSGRRQDDLREMEARYLRTIAELESGHQREMAELRAHYDQKLRQSETDRIDAIRKVDVDAVQRAAEVQAAAQQALATQVVTQAEAVRNQVATTASATAAGLATALEPMQRRIDDLTRAQYESAGGRAQVVESREDRGETRARGMSAGAWVGVAVGALGLILAACSGLAAVAGVIIALTAP